MSISSSGIGRPRRGRLYIIIGIILAVLAFATAAGLASLPLLSSNSSGTKVVVAKNDIGARNKIQASDLELKAVSPIPPESFTDVNAVGGKGARVDIPAGAPVTANLIAQAPDLLSSSDVTFLPIPKGYVATTVPTSEEVGVAGYVQVGDRITMLATINTSEFGASPGAPVVRTVFRDINVIRVGPATSQPATPQVSSSLTLLMTGCDSEYLFWLLNNAQLKYDLESPSDYGATPTQPNPSCPSVASAGGVGPRQVNLRWHFTSP
jgi:pilus assembly protein CpaB